MSVDGVTVSIVASQAAVPGSTPGRRNFLKFRNFLIIYIIKKLNYFSLIVILTVTLLVTLVIDCNFVSNFGGYLLYI